MGTRLIQAIDVKPLQLTGFTRDTLTKIVSIMGHSEFIAIGESNGSTMHEKRLKNLLKGQKHHQFEKFVEKKDLGVYLPWEHIDNPKQYSKTKTDSQAVEPDLKDINFVPGSQSDPLQWEHKIHDYQRMKAYIATRRKSMRSYWDEWYIKNDRGSNKPNWLSSKEYVMEKLDDAYTQKNQRKSAFSLGSALHVLEDFLPIPTASRLC